MQHSRDRDGEGSDVDAAFADPAFAEPKARGAPFAILRPGTGEVLWANAAAAEHWGAGDASGLARILFGPDGRGGWIDGLVRGLVPGRAPRLARAGLARGFRMRAHTALIHAWTDRDGMTLVGLAVPDAEPSPAADADAWRRPAWGPERAAPAVVPEAGPAPDEAGPALARRGQLAVLRDRLSRALDGAAALRLLWRTDAEDVVTAIDAAAFARLGSPLRFDGSPLPDAVAPFDPASAGRLRSALAARTTWAGIAFDLPVAAAAATVPVVLSGSPVFGPDRAFMGFRGFGTIDLGRIALAERRPPAAGEPADGEPTDGEPALVPPPALPDDGAPDEGADRPAAAVADGPVPAADAEPPAESRPPANVVQLRAFQGSAPVRFGATPLPPPAEPAVDPSAALPPVPGDGPVESGGEPLGVAAETGAAGTRAVQDDQGPTAGALVSVGALSDQLAFLALGEALRARIGTPPPDDGRPEPAGPPAEVAPPPAAALDEAASHLLGRLPVAVLATVADRPVFANAAAAARLGYADPEALLGDGDMRVSAVAGADRMALGGAGGRAASMPARRADVSWAGAPATLWLLGEPPEAAVPEAAEDRSLDLLDRIDDAVALLDAAGRLRRLNRRGEGWFGRAEGEAAPARGFTDLLAPESRAVALALLGEVRNQRDGLGAPPLRRDVVARTAEGGAVPMLLTLGRLGAAGFYATLRDVSALRRAESDRARSERDHARATGRLPDLLAKVSHEIRTPLGAILGFAEVMMDERFGPIGNPRYRDYLKDIHAAGAQVVALVDDLLDLSRIEAGQFDLAVAAVDVNRVVTEAVARMQPEAHRERVIMRTSLAGRIPPVLADERSARQIVKNLLSNAVKFNEPGGQVIVSTALGEGGAVLLRVRDTGVGMSDDEIAAALEPFGGLPARPPAHGNGLGLPLTRALVGANGASMTIRSRPREGTLVEVSFAPAEPGEARRPA